MLQRTLMAGFLMLSHTRQGQPTAICVAFADQIGTDGCVPPLTVAGGLSHRNGRDSRTTDSAVFLMTQMRNFAVAVERYESCLTLASFALTSTVLKQCAQTSGTSYTPTTDLRITEALIVLAA